MARPMQLMRTPVSPGDEPVAPTVVVSRSGPKRRRPSWVVLGVVMVGLAMLLGAWVLTTTSQRISVLVAAREIAPGEVVSAADVRVVEMGRTTSLRALQPSQQSVVIGQAARGPIPEGTVLNTGLFASRDRVIPVGQVVVGAALEPGAAPIGELAAGDRVDVMAVVKAGAAPGAAESTAPAVVTSGSVWSVEPAASASSSSKMWVSLLVPSSSQVAVAQAAADGRLRLSLVGAGG